MNKNTSRSLIIVLLLLFLFPALLPGADGDNSDQQINPHEKEVLIQNKITELQERIKSYAEAEKSEVAEGLNVSIDQLRERTDTLQEMLAFYNRQLMALRKHEVILKEKKLLNESISTGEAFELENSPPYSLKFFDDFTARLTEGMRKQETSVMALSVSKKSLKQAKTNLKEEGLQYRELKGKDPKTLDAQEAMLYQWRLGQAEREVELAQTAVEYHEHAMQTLNWILNCQKSGQKSITRY